MAIRVKRDQELRVRVSKDVSDRLNRISDLMGTPPATCAALAVGHWVASQEKLFAGALPELIKEAPDDQTKAVLTEQLSLLKKSKG